MCNDECLLADQNSRLNQPYMKNTADSAKPVPIEDTARKGYKRCDTGEYTAEACSA